MSRSKDSFCSVVAWTNPAAVSQLEIKKITILIDIEVMDATSYFFLLGND